MSKKKIAGIVSGVLAAVVVIAGIAVTVSNRRNNPVVDDPGLTDTNNYVETVKMYSGQLDENGLIYEVSAGDYVTLPDIKSLKLKKSDFMPTDAEVTEKIYELFSEYLVVDFSKNKTVEEDSVVQVDYVAKIDGAIVSELSTGGKSKKVDIANGEYIGDFAKQLIGHKNGEMVKVTVELPEDYEKPEYAGKTMELSVLINGIYGLPEFTEEFISENYVSGLKNYEELFEYVKNDMYETVLNSVLTYELYDKAVVNDYPEAYLNNILDRVTYEHNEAYAQEVLYNQFILQTGTVSKAAFFGVSEEEYDDYLLEKAKELVDKDLKLQALYEYFEMNFTKEQIVDFCEENNYYDSYITDAEKYGEEFMTHQAVNLMIQKSLIKYVDIE